jgi:hypothetical protein
VVLVDTNILSTCLDLAGILRRFWRSGKLTKEQVSDLIEQIENRDRVVLKHKERILAE